MSEANTVDQEVDYLSMSDEELLNAKPPVVVAPEDEEDIDPENPDADKVNAEDKDTEVDPEDQDDDDKDPEGAAEEEGDKPDDEKAAEESEEDAEDKQDEKPAADAKPEAGDKQAKDSSKEAKQASSEEPKIDFEAEYKRLLAPFKANGRDIQVKSTDEAITLMQMGANYNKKMAALKPNLKLMKLLENNGLLTEEKIGFLIDLEKKNPAAINKLVKDSGIDPMDLDAEKASAYRQTSYTVDDREIELDTVLDELQGTPSYNRTLDVVSTKWDAASKQVIAGAPQLLKVINDHIASGIYDLISKEVENERMFGRLSGLSDIEAYRRTGDALHAKGAFNHLVQGTNPAQGQPAKGTVIEPKPKAVEVDDKRNAKKRAASSTKPAVSTQQAQDFDPLSLSDDEFAKLVNKKFL
jgi:hypothetical protein